MRVNETCGRRVVYKREKNSDEDSKTVDPEDQWGGEAIADAQLRMQLTLRSKFEPEKRTEPVSVGEGVLCWGPRILAHVPWEELTGNGRESASAFGHDEQSWSNPSHTIVG